MEDADQKIIVSIASDGSISAETIGIKGERCLQYIEILEQLLDATTLDSSFTPEFYETTIVSDEETRNVVKEKHNQ